MSTELKNAYISKLEAQMKEWEAELDRLKAKAQKAVAQGRINYEKQLNESGAKREALRRKVEELKKSGEDRWEALKAGVEGAWNEFKSSVDRSKKEAS